MSNAETRIPLVFLPGLTDDASLWSRQIEALSDCAQCTVADLRHQDSVDEMTSEVLASQKGRFAVVGFSLGGYVALDLLRKAPDRILKAGLMCTTARQDSPARRTERKQQMMDAAAAEDFVEYIMSQVPKSLAPSNRSNSGILTALKAMRASSGLQTYLRQNEACLNRRDSLDLLPHITSSVSVIGGREDPAFPVHVVTEMARLIPTSRLEILDNCGHYAPLEQTEKVNALLREWVLVA